METRANYIAVGLMTLVAIVAAFFFIYWAGNYEGGDDRRALNVRIVGSVSGLAVGSAVQFNGIDVGRVTALGLDQSDPRFVIVSTSIDPDVPVRSDTRASIGVRGLSGGAFVQLEGGSPNAAGLLTRETPGAVPLIEGDPSTLNELIDSA